MDRFRWHWKEFPYSPEEHVCCFKTALTFVDSVFELWGPLLHGLSVLVLTKGTTRDPEKLINVLDKYKVERLMLVPSLLRSILMVLRAGQLDHLTTWICTGEPLPAQLARDFFNHYNDQRHKLCNFYGSTEVMGDVSYHVLSSASEVKQMTKVPIGRPVENSTVYLLDNNYRPVVSGDIGELYVSDFNLALGYVNNREPERWMPNPLNVEPGNNTSSYKH